jgi:hypothetical protein
VSAGSSCRRSSVESFRLVFDNPTLPENTDGHRASYTIRWDTIVARLSMPAESAFERAFADSEGSISSLMSASNCFFISGVSAENAYTADVVVLSVVLVMEISCRSDDGSQADTGDHMRK